jgi:hypothetical protein
MSIATIARDVAIARAHARDWLQPAEFPGNLRVIRESSRREWDLSSGDTN